MIATLFDSTTVPLLEQVVSFTEARHGVLAGNVANIDTPGYKTRDLSPEVFEKRLREAVEARQAPPWTTSGRQADELQNSRELSDVAESMKGILLHDESNVNLERQITEIIKNQTQHNLAVNIMSAQFRLLRAAVTERIA
jgi:flagellar basal-body rod protein FlgB